MNRPNATPSLETLWTPRSVGLGCQRLPGALVFEKPSKKMTKSRRKVDRMPNIEVYESNDRGRKTLGKRLNKGVMIRGRRQERNRSKLQYDSPGLISVRGLLW